MEQEPQAENFGTRIYDVYLPSLLSPDVVKQMKYLHTALNINYCVCLQYIYIIYTFYLKLLPPYL